VITLLDQALLIGFYVSPKPPFDMNDTGVQKSFERLLAEGLVIFPGGVEVTDRGRVYCEAMRAIPLPIQQWVIPAHPTGEKHV
jgi:hypothetical protein